MSSPGKLCLFNGHRLSTVKFLKHNTHNIESLLRKQPVLVQSSLRKAVIIPPVKEVNQKTGTLTQQINARAHVATDAGTLKADFQLRL